MTALARLTLAMDEPQSVAEQDMLALFRESSENDRTMLTGLLRAWISLSTAHRGLVFRVADALNSAARWRQALGDRRSRNTDEGA